MTGAPRSGERGFTLVEVVVSIVIVAAAFVSLLTSLGQSADDAIRTVLHRKMRYLAQLQITDIRLGKIVGDEEEERYEEGMTGTYEGIGSNDDPDEFVGFEFSIETFRDEVIVGGYGDEEDLVRSGFETDNSGQLVGRPVTNDRRSFGGLGGEDEGETEPEGQMKRFLVLSIRRLGDNPEDDMELRLATYLPLPDEEERQLGGEGEGPATPGGESGGTQGKEGPVAPASGGASGDRK